MTDTLHDKLQSSINHWNLLESKFYQAWSAGTLPIEGLKAYANEYGAFISMLPSGWEVQDDQETAEEEREHIELWEDFAKALGTSVGDAKIEAVQILLESTKQLFSNPVTALGALYAFEVQQPETSVSKLEGLKKHYSVDKSAEPYFEVHSSNHHEAKKLLERISKLSAEDQGVAAKACEEMSMVLRKALDGLYEAHPACGGCGGMN